MGDILQRIIAAGVLLASVLFAFFFKKDKVDPINPLPDPAPTPSPTPEPSPIAPPEPEWTLYPAVANYSSDDTFLADITNHTVRRDIFDLQTSQAHETTHYIHADIRNKYRSRFRNVAGFYVGGDRAVIFDQPQIRKRQIAEFVPSILQGHRFNTYIIGQTTWDNSPLYIYDEWVAYANGSNAGVELVEKKKYNGPRIDGLYGMTEFCIYALAVVQAIDRYDSEYPRTTPQFLEFTYWHIYRCAEIIERGRDMIEFRWPAQDRLLQNLRTSPEAKTYRDLLKSKFGGVFL